MERSRFWGQVGSAAGSGGRLVVLAAALLGACTVEPTPATNDFSSAVDPEDTLPLEGAVNELSLGEGDQAAGAADVCPATTVLYLNFEGARLVSGVLDNAEMNVSGTLLKKQGKDAVLDFPAATVAPAIRAQIHALVSTWYRAYNVRVVTDRPSSGPYTMILFGGNMALLGEFPDNFEGAGGIAGVDCGNKNKSSLGFVWEDVALAAAAKIKVADRERYLILRMAKSAAHEAGHSFGLNHIDFPKDQGMIEIMMGSVPAFATTGYDPNRFGFFDEEWPSTQDSNKCSERQNSAELLRTTLGRAGCMSPEMPTMPDQPSTNPMPPETPPSIPPDFNPGPGPGVEANDHLVGQAGGGAAMARDEDNEADGQNGVVFASCSAAPGDRIGSGSPFLGMLSAMGIILAALGIASLKLRPRAHR